MRVFVTGATGFVGLHLLRFLLNRGHVLFGTYIAEKPSQIAPGVKLYRCDIRDGARLRTIFRRVRPQRVYHLAALSSVKESFTDFQAVYDTNFWGTFHLLEAVRQNAPEARLLVVGSSQCYGAIKPSRLPVDESHPFSPQNPYALSKASADLLAGYYHRRFRLHVIRARPFNHTGPGQAPNFVCSDFARQIAAIELGLQPPVLRTGDIDVRRDFSDVRDVVRAYELLLEKAKSGEAYNVASGHVTPVRQIVRILASFCPRPIRITVQRQRLRPHEEQTLYGSIRKLQRTTGWEHEYNLKKTLRDLYLYWKVSLQEQRQ